MGILEICIIVGVALGCVVAVVKATKKKKKPKAKENKSAKTETPKAPATKQPDRAFKIERKERVTKISKNALKTNSRTAQVEKVFTREEGSDKSVLIDDNHSSSNSTQTVETQSTNQFQKNMSSGNAGYFNGDYNGIHLGAKRLNDSRNARLSSQQDDSSENQAQKSKENLIDEFTNIDNLFSRIKRNRMPEDKPLSDNFDFRKRFEENIKPTEPEIDFNTMVETDAILNPKYKAFNNKDKKTLR